MDLGARIRQARLEAGLSQRQLCGQAITRNMLSQIENGSARPSMDTLQHLARQLHRPVSYFLEEEAVFSPNQALMEAARRVPFSQAPQLLQEYQAPDPMFDRERWLLEALGYLELARQALEEGRLSYACSCLDKAAWAGDQTPYYTRELERSRLLLVYQAGGAPAWEITEALPELEPELLVRGTAALDSGDPQLCQAILGAAPTPQSPRWHILMGDASMKQKNYAQAAHHFHQAEDACPERVWAKLERCCRELEDYKMAYHYACKQRGQDL